MLARGGVLFLDEMPFRPRLVLVRAVISYAGRSPGVWQAAAQASGRDDPPGRTASLRTR